MIFPSIKCCRADQGNGILWHRGPRAGKDRPDRHTRPSVSGCFRPHSGNGGWDAEVQPQKGPKRKLIYEEWDKEVKIKFRFRGLRMVFDSKRICEFLINDMKMFHGKGKCQNTKIPGEIYEDWNLAKYTIRGIADTDGSVFVSKKPGIEKYPSIEITTTSQNLANQLKQILVKRGFRVSLRENIRKQINALKAYKIALYGKKNLKKWVEEIGFTNPYKLNRALDYLKI